VSEVLPSARQLPVEEQGAQAAWETTLAKVPTAQARPAVNMLMEVDTVCDTLTVYVPAPPAVPVSCAVTMVFAATVFAATPLTSEVRAIVPVGVPDTVSVVPEIVPMNCTEPVATGQ